MITSDFNWIIRELEINDGYKSTMTSRYESLVGYTFTGETGLYTNTNQRRKYTLASGTTIDFKYCPFKIISIT